MLCELVVMFVGHKTTNAAGETLGQRKTLGQSSYVANSTQKNWLPESDA